MSRPPKLNTEQILQTAREHFIQHGHTASVQSIGRTLGVSHSALLQRFGSKRALLIAALRPPSELPWDESLLNTPPQDEADALEKLREVSEVLMRFLSEHMHAIQVLHVAGVPIETLFTDELPFPLLACADLAAWIERGVTTGVFIPCKPTACASVIVGTMMARARLSMCVQLCGLSGSHTSPHAPPTDKYKGSPGDIHLGALDEVIAMIGRILGLNTR